MHEFEITPVQVARLVLGYLKSEKCDEAYEAFLKSSKHLKEYKGRIITRVNHKTLVDFLTEFSQLNVLIQERIEETSFYNEHNSTTTLLDQLNYLLDSHYGGKIRASTPNRSPIQRRFTLSDVGVNTEFCDNENLDVRATSLEDLPGNSDSNCEKKKPENRLSGTEEKKEEEAEIPTIDFEILTQTLLEHHELHEKLADTINVVRNASDQSDDGIANKIDDKNNTVTQDVEAAIKTIVQKATSDPFFDKLVKEVIGEDENDENNQPTEQNGTNQNPGENVKFQSSETTVDTQNSVVVNSNNVLMVQTASSFGTIDISKPCYVLNNAPQPVYSTGKILSEQDIMSMPIVVCDDSKQDKQTVNQLIIPGSINQPVAPTYLVNLTSNNEINPSMQFYHSGNKIRPTKRKRIKPTTIFQPEPVKIVPQPIAPKTEPIRIEIREPIVLSEEEKEVQSNKPSTSSTVSPSREVQTKNATSRSHVKALNFSTSQKQCDFDKNEQKKEQKVSWDADLRQLIQSSPQRETVVKKKRATTKAKRKKALSKTTEEGKLIEMALCENKKNDKKTSKSEREEVISMEIETTENAVENVSNKLSSSKLSTSKLNVVNLIETPGGSERKRPSEKNTGAISAVKRNIIESLLTPVKLDVCPKTPGFFSPINNTDTPLTKVLKEQLHGIDISTIPTPKFPVTPNFPITPSVDARYMNRGTDYSSASSYYNPSDNENNRSIEQLIEECKRLEDNDKGMSPEKKIHILDDVKIPAPPPQELKAVADKMKAMNKSVIGRKNLKLIEHVALESSSSTCTGYSSDSSSENSEASKDDKFASCNETVIANQTTQRYSLRLKKKAESPVIESNTTETITEILNNVQMKDTLQNTKTQQEILLEMEEKRKKTIEKLEKDQQKRRKVEEKKESKKKVVKKPVSKKQKTEKEVEADRVEKELFKNAASSTPNITKTNTEEKKWPLLNEKTEKTVGDLKAILNADNKDKQLEDTKNITENTQIIKAENIEDSTSSLKNTPSKTKIRKSRSKKPCSKGKTAENIKKSSSSDESSTKSKLDISLDEVTESLLMKLCKQKTESKNDKNKQSDDTKNMETVTENTQNKIKKENIEDEVTLKTIDTENLLNSSKNISSKTKIKESCPKMLRSGSKTREYIKKASNFEESATKLQFDESLVEETEKLCEQKSESKIEQIVDASKEEINNENNKTKKLQEKEDNKLETVCEELIVDSKKESVAPEIFKEDKKKLCTENSKQEITKTKKTEESSEIKVGKTKKSVRYSDELLDKDTETEKVQNKKLCENKQKPKKLISASALEKNKAHVSNIKRLNVEKVCEKLFSNLTESEKQETNFTKIEIETQKESKSLDENSTEKCEKKLKTEEPVVKKSTENISDKQETNTSADQNAEQLVNDLKERGIHLIPNKSLKQQSAQEVCLKNDTTENESQLDLFESEFSVCLFHRENKHFSYDTYKRPNKNISDYDFSLLKKEMSAMVYLAEFDADVERVISCTPFDTLLDIPSKIDAMPKKTSSPKKDRSKELRIEDKQTSKSPLEGLYEDEKNKSSAINSEGVVVKKKEKKKTVHQRTRSLSNSQKPGGPIRKSIRIKSRRSSEPRSAVSKEILTEQEKDLNKPFEFAAYGELCTDDVENELMNYAAAGSPEKYLKKRKADEKPEDHHIDKKIKPEKCKELLKGINVDEFLSHLHGDT